MKTTLAAETLAQLRTIVGEDRLLLDAADLHAYGQDWTRFYPPAAAAILLPGSVEEVQAIVAPRSRFD